MEAAGGGRPRTAILTTTSSDSALAERTSRALARAGAACRILELGSAPSSSPAFAESLLEVDLLHLQGENVEVLLRGIERAAVREALHRAWSEGVVLTGSSAAAACVFEHASSSSPFAPFLPEEPGRVVPGLGFLDGGVCVHYDLAGARREAFHRWVVEGGAGGWGIDHHAGLHFRGRGLSHVVAFRPGASATEVRRSGEGIREERRLGREPRRLSVAERLARRVVSSRLRRWAPRLLGARTGEPPR